jgi:hypothetical protein
MILKNFKYFKEIFSKKTIKSEIDECFNNILEFINANNIKDWDDFVYADKPQRDIINLLIDSTDLSLEDINEVKFRLRVTLSNRDQLKKLLIKYEYLEDYEKCEYILSEINRRN